MKPIDEDVTPPPEDIPEDVEAVEAEIEEEIKPRRRRRSRRRRSKLQEYSSIGSMIAWMSFLVIWLFFFASGYGIFENIAVVLVALLIVFALNAVTWIPLDKGWKARTSAISAVVWFIFLILWIVFFAGGFGFYENIGIGLASLMIIGAVNVLLWVPSAGEEGGARISALGGIGWLTFIVLWLPFANNVDIIFPIFPYKNVAIILASFLLMLLVVIAPWGSGISISIDEEPGVAPRLKGTMGGFVLWLVFIVIWMWFFAGNPPFLDNQNVAVILLSFAILCAIMLGMWLPWSRRRGEGPENWWAIGLAFIWVLVLALWFWFFADNFLAPQNFAVFLVTLLIMAAISGFGQWKKYRDFESMDWDD
ncbi:MAG: hypothetical protein ThorAB25_25960 [Candidatus Thorarchaeota archaeon AB_25]|nr:MAG: hypothetical protein ThorAB25_25960 [Candidatus Thorarchaeota archaeon AB_25]